MIHDEAGLLLGHSRHPLDPSKHYQEQHRIISNIIHHSPNTKPIIIRQAIKPSNFIHQSIIMLSTDALRGLYHE